MSFPNTDNIERLSQFQKVKSSNGSGNSSRTEPYPLWRELPPPEKYQALGSILAPAAKRLRETIKAPDGICGQSILAAAALVAQSPRDFEIDGRQFPLSENFMSIAESGDRKTAVDTEVLNPTANMKNDSTINTKRR